MGADPWDDRTEEQKKSDEGEIVEEVIDDDRFDLAKQIANMQAELGIRPAKTEEQKKQEKEKKRAVEEATGERKEKNDKEDKEDKEDKDEKEMQAILTPAERSRKYYERAKAFYTQSGGVLCGIGNCHPRCRGGLCLCR